MLPEDLRSLPYLVHTNGELGLMLAGKKPLALMGYTEGFEIDFVQRYLRMFDRHVASGRLTKHEDIQVLRELGGRRHYRLYYTLPGEEWRVAAMKDLLFATPGGWSHEKERRYGELLGYEDWQNDVWLSRAHERAPNRPAG